MYIICIYSFYTMMSSSLQWSESTGCCQGKRHPHPCSLAGRAAWQQHLARWISGKSLFLEVSEAEEVQGLSWNNRKSVCEFLAGQGV